MQRAPGAASLLIASLLVGGCFDEIIKNPGATEGSTDPGGDPTTSSGGGASEGATSGSSGPGSTTTPPDADVTGGSGTGSTGEVETSGGLELFCPDADYPCGADPWEVEPCGDCQDLTPLAECVLGQLRDGACGAFAVDRCEGGCVRDYYFLRCSGDGALIETIELDGQGHELASLGVQFCTTAGSTYFDQCVNGYEPSCADPDTWVIECVPFLRAECPITL